MKIKSKNGSVAVYALLSITVLVALLFSIYFIVNIRHKNQLKTASDIRREVEEYNEKDKIEIIEDPFEIYIYEEWQIDKIKTNEYVYLAQENKIYKFTDTARYINLFIKPGDKVYYDPTVGVSDPSTLQYTSIKGFSRANGDASNVTGNGYNNQLFRATSNDNKWIVLFNDNGRITLLSDDLKSTIAGGDSGKLIFLGPTGYIFAEQELYRICSIYGRGRGATKNPNYIVDPKIGSPDVQGDLQPVNFTESGGRSITIEDIEKLVGIDTDIKRMEATKFYRGDGSWYNNIFAPYFGKNIRPNSNIRIPTLNIGTSGYYLGKPKYTYYNISKNDPNMSNEMKDHIFKTGYWLASRSTDSVDVSTDFSISLIGDTVYRATLMYKSYVNPSSNTSSYNSRYVRPVVTIDIDAGLLKTTRTGYDWEVDQS